MDIKRIQSILHKPIYLIIFLGLPILLLVIVYFPRIPSIPVYQGGYAPDGEYCDSGYNRALRECCDDDDYSCEMCDLYGIYCDYKDGFQGEFFDIEYFPKKAPKNGYDCSDFRSWDEAQKVFIRDGGPKKDPYHLDSDRDGIACEELLKK